MGRRTGCDDSLRCSFCHKAQGAVGKLISTPGDYPRAYICDQCIAVCAMIVEDDNVDTPATPALEVEHDGPHPLLSHPLASELMEAIVKWTQLEETGNAAPECLARVRELASRMLETPAN